MLDKFNASILQDNEILIWIVTIFYFLALVTVTLRGITKCKPIGVSLAWLILIYAIPLLGMFSYLIFGELTLGKKRKIKREALGVEFKSWLKNERIENKLKCDEISLSVSSMESFVEAYTSMPMLKKNKLTLLSSTKKILNELTEKIDSADTYCYFLFYILEEGGLVKEVIEALIRASNRGVDCKLLLDSVGSNHFFKSESLIKMRAAGITIHEALPVGALRILFQRQDLRMHRKLICIDDNIAYTGSMNLVDPTCFNIDKGVGNWVDMMVRCEGSIVQIMKSLFIWDWFLETDIKLPLPVDATNILNSSEATDQNVQLIPSGPEFGKASIHQVLLMAIYEAKNTLVLTSPYFVPDESLNEALQAAAIRGVDVKIIVPAKNDSVMVKYASASLYEDLLSCGVKIYKFNGGLLHSKSIVVDGLISLVGTVNLDRRSFWLNFEMTLLVDSKKFAQELVELQSEYLLDSNEVKLDEWKNRNSFRKLFESILYLFSPLL